MNYIEGSRIIFRYRDGRESPGVITAVNNMNRINPYHIALDTGVNGWTSAHMLKSERMIPIEDGGITRA